MSVLDPTSDQVPGTFRDSVGSGVSSASGAENCTVMWLERPIAVAPNEGEVLTT
jgi:hypothetical protein